jgi:probable F420-dependent oxidoreductase
MKYGICIFPTEYSMQPAELGQALEARGFESLWVAEHTHIPCSRKTPWPGGAELPKMYYDVYAPLIALAAVAAATKTLKIATGIQLVAQHDPLVLAKEIATLDQISRGRFLFGVGGGWNREELANHYDFPFTRRWKVMRERIEAMKAVWTQEKAAYHGEFVDFDEVFSWPKPLQKPHPPIHVGGAAP